MLSNMLKNNYQWVLFDADETLFHFNDFAGLKQVFRAYNVDFTQQDYLDYQSINKPLWIAYQNHTITAKQLQEMRFQEWGHKLNVSPGELNSAFMLAMADVCTPIKGAINLLDRLRDVTNVGIITNGFTELQRIRLERTGLTEHIDLLVVSEEVGVAKPHPNIFNHALTQMGHPERESVLMVGDNPDSDIIGAINAGLHSCWVNRHSLPIPQGIQPHYHVSSLSELEALLFSQA